MLLESKKELKALNETRNYFTKKLDYKFKKLEESYSDKLLNKIINEEIFLTSLLNEDAKKEKINIAVKKIKNYMKEMKETKDDSKKKYFFNLIFGLCTYIGALIFLSASFIPFIVGCLVSIFFSLKASINFSEYENKKKKVVEFLEELEMKAKDSKIKKMIKEKIDKIRFDTYSNKNVEES